MGYTKSKIVNACLNLTDDCNLRCKYCFVSQHPNYMSYHVAQDAFDMIWENAQEIKTVPHFTFFGGEPLLLWDKIIVPLVNYAKRENKEATFSITSNCLLLDKYKVDFMKNNNIALLFSADGDKVTQDLNRPTKDGKSSFDIIYPKFNMILGAFPGVTFRSTFNQDCCDKIASNFFFAADNGFYSVYNTPSDWGEWSQKNLDDIKEELSKIGAYYCDCFLNGEEPASFNPLNESFLKIIRHNLAIGQKGYETKHAKCAVNDGYGAIAPNGDIYICQQTPSKGPDSIYYLGDIYNGEIEGKRAQIRMDYLSNQTSCAENPDYCDFCPMNRFCANDLCMVNNMFYNEDWNKVPFIRCYWNRCLFEEAVKITTIMDFAKNETFKKFFEKQCLKECKCDG